MAEAAPAAMGDAPVAPAKSKLLLIVLCSLAAAAAAGVGVYFMLGSQDKQAQSEEAAAKDAKGAKATKGPALYVKFDPPFVVNFENKGMMRFLQVSVEVMTRDPATADLIKLHDPVLRNDMLMLLGNQTYDTISTREGKERLRGEALQTVAKVVAAEGGKAADVEQLYFTSFVMQ